MRTQFIVIKQIKTPIKISKSFYLFDIAFILIYVAIWLQAASFVHEWLYYPYLANCVAWGIFFTKKSSLNKGKRNWQSILYYAFKSNVIYESRQRLHITPKGESTL